MNKFLQFILFLFGAGLGMYIVTSIANFFSIGFQFYGTYLFFGMAMGIFYYFLPSKPMNIFAEN